MLNKNKIFIILAFLTVIFNFFFWKEKLGLNLFIFTALLTAGVYVLNSSANKKIISLLIAVFYSSAMVLYINSGLSIFACIVSVIILTGFIHQPQLRSILSAFFTSMSSCVLFPYNVLEEIRLAKNKYKYVSKSLKIARIGVIPIVFFFVFYGIYAYANPIFNSYSNSFWDSINNFLKQILIDYPPERFLFILFGLFIATGVLFNRNIRVFLRIDLSYLNTLMRDNYRKLISRTDEHNETGKRVKGYFRFKMTSLKTEYKIGVILLILVNFLLLILNIIDISFVWIGFDSSRVENLAYFVHEGTYYLIFSIVLSMAILLYFFRGNLNFYSKSKLLRYSAYFWILQNAVMAISVALRNYYYIEYYYALSYKRIGVFIFLALTFTGLVTMFIKIYGRKTAFYLVKVNSLAVFIVMLAMGSMNWDENIAKFNLSNPNKDSIDLDYLLNLSDASLPVLYQNKDIFKKTIWRDESFRDEYYVGLYRLEERIKLFSDKHQKYSWLSWNYSDMKVKEYFEINNARSLQ